MGPLGRPAGTQVRLWLFLPLASWLQCHLPSLSPPESDSCYKGWPTVGRGSCFKDSSPETPSCREPGR